jgi:hypothetical protein
MEKKKAPKKTTKKPAKKPAEKKTPPAKLPPFPLDREQKVLSFTYVTTNGKRGSYAQLVDAKIGKEEMAAIIGKKAKGGEVLKAQLIPYAPRV